MDHPDEFLKVIFHDVKDGGDDLALCAGFERGKWRYEQLADHIMEWLPEFALNYSDLQSIGHSNAVKILKKAAKTVYQSEKYRKRGEFGEILLHIAIRQVYETLPAISKIYYKTGVNDTVKGFDAVHVVKAEDGLELWVGEVKFYQTLSQAIYDVAPEIIDHLETDYLKSEFILIKNKIDPLWPESESLNELLHDNKSLDEVFKRICIPVLLTYNSNVVATTKENNETYIENIKKELESSYMNLRSKISEKYKDRFLEDFSITLHVIFIPLKDKAKLVEALDTKLKAFQK